jgi:glycerophosphoryl diester phosphodiesterase
MNLVGDATGTTPAIMFKKKITEATMGVAWAWLPRRRSAVPVRSSASRLSAPILPPKAKDWVERKHVVCQDWGVRNENRSFRFSCGKEEMPYAGSEVMVRK